MSVNRYQVNRREFILYPVKANYLTLDGLLGNTWCKRLRYNGLWYLEVIRY